MEAIKQCLPSTTGHSYMGTTPNALQRVVFECSYHNLHITLLPLMNKQNGKTEQGVVNLSDVCLCCHSNDGIGLAILLSADLAEAIVGRILGSGSAGHFALHVEEHLRHELCYGHLISNIRHLQRSLLHLLSGDDYTPSS